MRIVAQLAGINLLVRNFQKIYRVNYGAQIVRSVDLTAYEKLANEFGAIVAIHLLVADVECGKIEPEIVVMVLFAIFPHRI